MVVLVDSVASPLTTPDWPAAQAQESTQMSHEVEQMFSVGETPWHGLGHVLEAAPSCADALVLAGLNWGVGLRPLTTTISDGGVSVAVPSHRAVIRQDTGAILGVVGDDFRPFPNADAFAFFEPLVEEKLITLETAGSLRNGRRVWIMARVAGVDPVAITDSDIIDPFVLLCHGHDGSLALRVGFNPVRVVCQNTLSLALDEGAAMFVLRHTAGLSAGLASIRAALAEQIRVFNGSREAWQFLAARACKAEDFDAYVLRVARSRIGESDDEVAEGETGGAKILKAVRPLFEGGKGNDAPGVAGTWWAAYNAVTEWLTHHRGSAQGSARDRAERRFEGLHLGDSRKLNARALMHALDGAERSGSPNVPPMPEHSTDGPLPGEVEAA
jgi:phage/plasmid-like protein (TIGR03299 family)